MATRIVNAPPPADTPLLDRQDLARVSFAIAALLAAATLGCIIGVWWYA